MPETKLKRKSLSKIPDEIEFYEHQILGVRMMAKMSSFLLADEMGLGKSLEALTVAAVDFERGYASRILVICPSFLKWNWAGEIEHMTNFSWYVIEGDPDKRRWQYANWNTEIMIISYDTYRIDREQVESFNFDIVIIDEAHYVKNRTSKRTKAVLRTKIPRRFVLTGSPMLNRPDELWTLLHLIDPKRFNKPYPFINRYCVFGGWQSRQIVGAKNRKELKGILQEYMVRRLKKDCLDLPDKQYITIHVDLHPEQEKLYKDVEADMKIHIPDNPNPMQAENILTRYLRLKQIAGTPAAIDEALPDKSYKLDRTIEMIQEFTDGTDEEPATPVVVFTQFRGVADAIERRLAIADIPCWQLNGDTPQPKRIPLTEEWANSANGKPGVLILMLQMAVGLNLTAANKCIFVDKLYVPKLNEQAEDRLHRIGADLTHPVQIFSVVARGTVEDLIEKILVRKRKLFDSLIEDESAFKKALIKAIVEEVEAA